MPFELEKYDDKIHAFWTWFRTQEATYRDFFEEETVLDKDLLIEAMNDQVLEFGLFSWQISEGASRPFQFIISPNGHRERLLLSKYIMKAAPDLPHWEFHAGKPARDWDLQLTLFDNYMIEHTIDASAWTYRLQPHPDGAVTIYLQAENIAHLDAETQQEGAERVVTGLLGEENRIHWVRRVAFETASTGANPPANITQLMKDLQALIA